MLVMRSLASFSCVMHVVRCKQKEETFFFVILLYNRECDWMSIQPIELPDREIHVFPAKLLGEMGGGRRGVGGVKINKKFSGGSHWRIRSGGRGAGPKKISRFEISRRWHLCNR